MLNKKAQLTTIKLAIPFLLLFLIAAFVIITKPAAGSLLLLLILVPVIFIITFINTDLALIILIFSMLLSPEITLAEVPGRTVVARIDDILLIVVFLSWLAKTAIHKELGMLKYTPLNKFMLAYIVACIFSTSLGIMFGQVKPITSFFYILRYFEYFLLYFLFTNNIRGKRQIKLFVAVFLITGVIVCIYAASQIGTSTRVTAPFEGVHPEPNTLGGYLLLLFAVCMSFFLYGPSTKWKILPGLLAFFIIPPFIFTLSRSSYMAFIFMYLFIVLNSRRKIALSISALALAIVLSLIFVPTVQKTIAARIEKTFLPAKIYKTFGKTIPLERSAAARVESWKRVTGQWSKSPLFGYGVTGVGLVDSQYPLVLGETGIIGFLIFLALLKKIYKLAKNSFKNLTDEWAKALSMGFIGGFIGLLVHSFATNTFIIVRIMEPFWFLAAIIVILPEIYPNPENKLES
jgi:hypothetical protein